MGDWSNFLHGVGEVVKEFSEVQAQKSRDRSRTDSQSETEAAFLPAVGDGSESSVDVREGVASQQSAKESPGPDKKSGESSNMGNIAAYATLGVAALGVGAYAAYKIFFSDDGKPNVTKSESVCEKRLRVIKEDLDEFPVLGLDCQWVINTENPYEPRNPIALLQLATHKGNTMLMPMSKFTLPDELKSILNDSEIIKTGFDVTKDARYLREDHGLEVQSTFDLRFLAEDTGHRPVGLEELSKVVLDLDIGPEWEIINSDWNKLPLDEHQVAYAEVAVKATIDIFKKLYPMTKSGSSKKDILAYCTVNKDRPFNWDAKKWD